MDWFLFLKEETEFTWFMRMFDHYFGLTSSFFVMRMLIYANGIGYTIKLCVWYKYVACIPYVYYYLYMEIVLSKLYWLDDEKRYRARDESIGAILIQWTCLEKVHASVHTYFSERKKNKFRKQIKLIFMFAIVCVVNFV